MASHLAEVRVTNYRSLADVQLALGPINVLFGPNGSGKSSLLDTIWFVRDCAIRSVELASSTRSHGIGILFDGADEDDVISILLATDEAEYKLTLGLSSGRIEQFPGESLYSRARGESLIDRKVGEDKARFYHAGIAQPALVPLREPQKLSLGRYLDFEDRIPEAVDLDQLLHYVHSYHARSFNLYGLKQKGSEMSPRTWLYDRGDNLWSVLRNLHDRQRLNAAYDTIMQFMTEAFPGSFDGILIEQTGQDTVYGSFLEKGRRKPIRASGVSDGHLQLLLLLTALFADGPNRPSLLLYDEPETSLHPWALAVFARAARLATQEWNKQIVIATHSPVLISQFEPAEILATDTREGRTTITRLSDMEEIKDLLEQYAPGSLYMAELVGAQRTGVEGNGAGQ